MLSSRSGRRLIAPLWLRSSSSVLLAVLVFAASAQAVTDKPDTGSPWSVKTNVGPDATVKGWLINLGPTGMRAKVLRDEPIKLEIRYVFPGSPAEGKVKVGDKITGANGRKCRTPHKFGYGMDVFGGEGPLMDLGNALYDSQTNKSRNGKLTLSIERDGNPMTVELKIKTQIPFAKTFPFDCQRSDDHFDFICEYLVKRQRENGLWHGRPHINCFAMLALMSSDNPKYKPMVTKAAKRMAETTSDDYLNDTGGHPCWRYGFYGICLGEYYLATGERWVLPELEQINKWFLGGQHRGGWGHKPWDEGGKNGYGPFNAITTQIKMAMGLMARCGIEIDTDRYRQAHEFIDRGANAFGYVWYKDGGKGNKRWADMGRTGSAALAYHVSPLGGQEYLDRALLHSKCIGDHPQTFPDTHGSPLLGMGWTALAASIDEKNMRKLMDYNRWWIVLAECEDGTYVYQPNRDNNPQDYTAAPRLSAMAAMGAVFAAKEKRLAILGAKTTVPGLNERDLTDTTRPIFDAIGRGKLGRAYTMLTRAESNAELTEQDKPVLEQLRRALINPVNHTLEQMRKLDRVGDVARLQEMIQATQTKYRGVGDYDRAVQAHQIKLRRPEVRREIALGQQYERLLTKAEQTRGMAEIRRLENFAQRNPDSVYGKAARAALKHLKTDEQARRLRDEYFNELLKDLPAG